VISRADTLRSRDTIVLRSRRYWSILKPAADGNAARSYHASFDPYVSLQSQALLQSLQPGPTVSRPHRDLTVNANQSNSTSCISHRLRRRNSRTVLHCAILQRKQHGLGSQGKKCDPTSVDECLKMRTTLCRDYCRKPILISPIGAFSTVQRFASISGDRPVLYSWHTQTHRHTGPPTRMRGYEMITTTGTG
jgi:hypothetical protein